MNTYKWPHASLSLTSAWSALGNPLGVETSTPTISGSEKMRSPRTSRFEGSEQASATTTREENSLRDHERYPVWYASRHAESGHVVPPGHNEGLETRYGGEVPV